MDFLNNFSSHDKEDAERRRTEEHRHHEEHDASKVHPAAQHEPKSSGSFLDKLTGREDQHESPEVENKRYHEEAEHEKHSFLDKITGKAEREEEERRRREEEERERERERLRREEEERNKNVFEKLGDKFSGHHIDDDKDRESEHRRRSSREHAEDEEKPSFLDKITGKAEREEEERRRREEEEKNKGFFDKLGDKFNTAAGGGRESEKNEDHLDKGIDFVQEHILKQGTQSDESAWEQKKDKMIADAIRSGYKSTTGHEFFLKEKEKEEKEKKQQEDKKHFWE